MIKAIVRRMLGRQQKDLGVPVDEAYYMLDHSLPALRAFSKVLAISEFHHTLPNDVYHIAKIAAYRQEDCGTCLQISVNRAKRDGVKPELIRAAAAGNVTALTPELRMIYRFAEMQANREDDPEVRNEIIHRFGHEGLIELALAITSTRTFPALKRVLGYATSCSRVVVEV